MLPQRKPYLSPEAYLAQERQAATRSDYWEGETYALAGASEAPVVYLRRIKEEGAEYELRLQRHQTGPWDGAERADEG